MGNLPVFEVSFISLFPGYRSRQENAMMRSVSAAAAVWATALAVVFLAGPLRASEGPTHTVEEVFANPKLLRYVVLEGSIVEWSGPQSFILDDGTGRIEVSLEDAETEENLAGRLEGRRVLVSGHIKRPFFGKPYVRYDDMNVLAGTGRQPRPEAGESANPAAEKAPEKDSGTAGAVAALTVAEAAGRPFGHPVEARGEVVFIISDVLFVFRDDSGAMLVETSSVEDPCTIYEGRSLVVTGVTEEDRYSTCRPSRVRIKATSIE
jgi:uncharacterized protein YdeI (BOF family)